MKIRKRVRLNTSFATKAISDRFPHFGATKIGDSGRHGNPHFSVFYTRFAAQSGYISFERRKCPIARRRIPLNRSTSGVRAPPAAFSSRRPCPRRADDPSGGRRSDGGKDAEGRVRNGRPTILPRPDGKRPVRPRIPARRQRSGAPKRSSVPQKRRTSLPADELRIARDIGSADDRLPVLARHAAERLPPRPAIPNTVFGTTRDDRRAGFCTIRKYRHFYTPESALFRSDRGAVRHRRGRISGRGSLGKEYRYAGHCRPTASYIGPAPTRLNVPASGGGGTSEAGRIGPDDNSAGSSPADRPVPHSQAEQTPLSASVTFRDTTDVPSVLSPNTGFRRQANGAPPSFAPSERKTSIREEGTAPPDTVSIRSGALPPSSPSARRFGLRFKQSGKNKSKPPAPYHRRLSRSRPSTHTRPRPVTSNGKQRKQGRPTNLLPPLPENLLFGENTKTVTIEKRLSEIRQTASFRSESGTTRNRTGDTRIFSPLLYQLSYGTININAYVS